MWSPRRRLDLRAGPAAAPGRPAGSEPPVRGLCHPMLPVPEPPGSLISAPCSGCQRLCPLGKGEKAVSSVLPRTAGASSWGPAPGTGRQPGGPGRVRWQLLAGCHLGTGCCGSLMPSASSVTLPPDCAPLWNQDLGSHCRIPPTPGPEPKRPGKARHAQVTHSEPTPGASGSGSG